MIKQYNVTVNGTTYEVTVESAAGGRMATQRTSPGLTAAPRLLLPPVPALSPAPCPAPSSM